MNEEEKIDLDRFATTRIQVIDELKQGGGCYIAFDDNPLMYFEEKDKRLAHKIAEHMYYLLDTGFENGLKLAVFNPEVAREEMIRREILPF